MHWFGGSIAEAVNLSKQRNAIFVVFVEGDNDLSVEMAATIDDTAVLTRLSDQDNFLAVKLKSGSPTYTHFAQIYQFVPVPSLFFIGRNGTPLEVVCAGVQPNNLATRIDRILEEHHKERPIQPSTSAEHVKEQTVNFLQTEARMTPSRPAEENEDIAEEVLGKKPSTEKKHSEGGADSSAPPAKVAKTDHSPEYEVVCKDDVCVRQVKSKTDEAGPSQPMTPPVPADASQKDLPKESESTASIEEKLERAKELIEARNREKSEKEKEAEKQKEIERRTQGKGVAELKRWQADQELKQIQEERKREKMENNLARQRILEQIAQDRAERKARDAPLPLPTPTTAPTPAVAHNSAQPATSGDSGGRARIQFKLPDGTSHTAHFPADSELGDVQRYVADNLQLSTATFSLWTAFPRRELTDTSASLLGLQLAPSAALLVLPRRTAPTIATTSSFTALVTYFTQLFTTIILEPSQQLYLWLRSRFFPPPTASTPREPSPSAPQPPQPSLGNLRRRGNIHRLPSDRPADDDNNTWNGNSTQQM